MADQFNKDLRVNGDRLWKRLMLMAAIGATEKGGCNRQALTLIDKKGRDLFISWCESAGCSISVDAIGNVFIRRSGKNNNLPSVMTGSHLDTQPTGGKFDGVYGVLAGLEVVETLNDYDIETEHPIDVVVWTNEEGARFSPAMMGSGVFAGVFDLEKTLKIKDKEGTTVAQALDNIGYAGSDDFRPGNIKASFEVHIEQGPILESESKQIGVVCGIQGVRWYDLIITGEPVHAGPTPMEVRQDPFLGLISIIKDLYQLTQHHGPWARATFGDIAALPGARNTVPQKLKLAIDLRHPDQEILNQMDQSFRQIVNLRCAKYALQGDIKDEWNLPAVKFSDQCVEAVREAADNLGFLHMSMTSGAGHDSGYISRVAPTSMIFIPCEKGISHNEAESAKLEDIEAGCSVLLHAMLKLAN